MDVSVFVWYLLPFPPKNKFDHMSDTQPSYFIINRKENSLSVRGPQPEKDWNAIFELIHAQGITGLQASEIPDAAMQRLPQQLTKLAAGGLTDEGLAYLERMPQLEQLDLGNWHSV